MGGQRQSPKGYVGSFLQFFDWNEKSRKKVFSNKSDNSELAKQKKKSNENLPTTQFNSAEMHVDKYVAASIFNESSDYCCASSVTDEEGYRSKAPSFVARLMGLDTMPTSITTETFSLFSDSQSLRESKNFLEKLEFRLENHIVKAQKTVNLPIEKFRSEILPPKKAKTVPVTQNRLLSPIKSSGLISSINASHIMESDAKILDPVPQASTRKTKMPSIGTSPVPFNVKDLREKVEAPRRLVVPKAAKVLNGQPMNKSYKGSPYSEDKKGKSISLALQAKLNVQKREGRKEPNGVILSQPLKSQSSSQKSNKSGALKQNNQRQNCTIIIEKLNSKPTLPNSQCGLESTCKDYSSGRYKNSNRYGKHLKVGSRKLSSKTNDSKQEVFYSSTKNEPRKRCSLDKNFSKDKDQMVDKMLIDRRFKGMDVVSFTFTAPLSRQNNVPGTDYKSQNTMLSPDSRNNVIGADNISIPLEQKLRELTQGAESSRHREGFSGNFAPIFQDVWSITMPHKIKNHDVMHMDILNGNEGSNFTSIVGKGLMTQYKLQGTLEVEECRSDETETKKSLHHRHPSPISVLDPSFITESWNSSDTVHSINMKGSKQGSSVQALEVFGMNTYTNPYPMELDTELADSASSIKTLGKAKKVDTFMTPKMGTKWELQYVREILFNEELFINPHLLDPLQSRKIVREENITEKKFEHKVLFDCVSECMDLRCSRYTNLGFRSWAKGISTMRRKEHLAENIYKEILGWKGIENTTVDDYLDKDMSNQYGKWLDFEVEVFELGVEIEGQILNSSISELVDDIVITEG